MMRTVRAGLAAVILGVAASVNAAGPVEIITHPDRAEFAIDRQLLLAVFTMRIRTWPDGRQARVFVLPDSDGLHDRFCREQLGTYPYVLRGIWDRMVFTGTGLAPETVRSEEEMKARVKATPGAIGYAGSPLQTLAPADGRALASSTHGDR